MNWTIRGLSKQSALLVLVTLSLQASAADLSILSAGATRSALSVIVENYQKHSGYKLNVEYAPVGVIMKALADGTTPDVIIVSADVVDEAEHKGWIVPGSASPVVSVGVGVAVKEQAISPDISSPEALKQTLLDAKSITYMNPEKGTSGQHFAEVLKRLGIAEQMKPKTILGESGYIVEPVARGEIEIGIQQITEILPVKGVKLVGPLPASLQKITT
jgi:molybdate transport system substrate-binding protein